jgi:hypothetical protein
MLHANDGTCIADPQNATLAIDLVVWVGGGI